MMQKIVKLHGTLQVFFICYMDYTEIVRYELHK